MDDLLTDGAGRAVDVGCGTGIVARLLVARGCRVVGVEADGRMAEVARSYGIEVEVSPFEEWDERGRRFDLLTSGSAWHWVRPDDGAAKAADVLRQGGLLAVFWNHPTHSLETMDAFVPIYERHAPQILNDSVALGRVTPRANDADAEALARNGSFEHIERRRYTWERVCSRAEWLDELPTHSNHRLLDPGVLSAILREVSSAIDGLGGSITTDYVTGALLAKRR